MKKHIFTYFIFSFCISVLAEDNLAKVVQKNGKAVIHIGKKEYEIITDSKTKMKVFKSEKADHIAYIPQRDIIVGWNNGDRRQPKKSKDSLRFLWMPDDVYEPFELPGSDKEAGFIRWQYSLKKEKFINLSIIPDNFIVRKGIDRTGIIAKKNLIFEIWAIDSTDISEPPIATIDLIEDSKITHSWELQELHPSWVHLRADTSLYKNINEIPKTTYHFLPQSFFIQTTSLKETMQFAHINKGNKLDAVSINLNNLSVRKILEDVIHTHQLPEKYLVNTKDGYRAQVIDRNNADYLLYEDFPLKLGRKTRNPLQYKSIFLAPSPLFSDLLLPINEEGRILNLTKDFIGLIPLSFEDRCCGREDTFSLTHGWLIATLEEKNGQEVIMWGWASSEFENIKPSLWIDIDIYEDYEQTENFRLSKKFKLGSSGIEVQMKLAEGPFWVGEFLDGSFQFYVYSNLILSEGTFSNPNTYSGKIKSAKTYKDAVDNGEIFLENFADDTNDDYQRELNRIIKWIKANNDKNAILEKALAKQKKEEKEQREIRIAAEKRQWEIWRAQRDNAYSKYMSTLEFGSLTKRLGHIRVKGNTKRATNALKSQIKRIRQKTRKAY